MGLLKLLYMADRLALLEENQTITGDNYVSTKYGPVLRKVFQLVKNKHYTKSNNFWKKYFLTTEDFQVKLLEDPGREDLSKADEELIIDVYQQCSNYDGFDLTIITIAFPEWTDPRTHSSSCKVIPIDNIELLKLLGKSDEEIKFISEMTLLDLYIKNLQEENNVY